MKDDFAAIKEFLDQNGIEYDLWTFCSIKRSAFYSGVHVTFYFDGIGNTREQRATFERKFLSSKKWECLHSGFSKKYFEKSGKIGIIDNGNSGAFVSYTLVKKDEYNACMRASEREEEELNQYYKRAHEKRLAEEV